jgi:hypothetical protein
MAVLNEKGFLELDGVSEAFLLALYRGRQGLIELGEYRFEMTNLGRRRGGDRRPGALQADGVALKR